MPNEEALAQALKRYAGALARVPAPGRHQLMDVVLYIEDGWVWLAGQMLTQMGVEGPRVPWKTVLELRDWPQSEFGPFVVAAREAACPPIVHDNVPPCASYVWYEITVRAKPLELRETANVDAPLFTVLIPGSAWEHLIQLIMHARTLVQEVTDPHRLARRISWSDMHARVESVPLRDL